MQQSSWAGRTPSQAAAHLRERLLKLSFSPMGILLDVWVDPAFAEAVDSAFSGWGDAADPGTRRLDMRITCDDRLEGTEPMRIAADGDRLRISGTQVEASADASSGTAVCCLSPALAGDFGVLRDEILDPLLLFLLTRSGRIPLHASAFLLSDVAVLLAGPSGSGKSCLALAAHRAGLPVLADDCAFVQLEPELRIWGSPRPARLYPRDSDFAGAVNLRNGKLKQLVELGDAPAAPARKAVVCKLVPGTRAELHRMDSGEAEGLFEPLEPGFDLLASQIREASRALLRNGAWSLTLSGDPAEAIRLLASAPPLLDCAA